MVKEDGRPRPIVSFEAFAGDEPNAPATRAPGVERERTTSAPAARSVSAVTVLLVDDGHLSPQQATRLRPALKGLLERIGERSGTLSLVAPWSKVSLVGMLPGGGADLEAAVDRIVGRRFEDHSTFPVSDTEAFAAENGDAQTLARLTGRFVALNPELRPDQAALLAHTRATEVAYDARRRRAFTYGVALLALDWLAGQPGRHSLVLVSGGFAREPNDPTYNEVVTRSLRVNAPIHFLDARGLRGTGRFQGVEYGPALSRQADETPFESTAAAEGLSGLADDTGGITIRNTNAMERGLGRLLDTMQTYYVLGYEPPINAKLGFRKIKVEARARGLQVRARRGYFVGASAGR